jgi:hypothetical protein
MFETGLALQPTQRELQNLLDLRIIKRHNQGHKVYYEIDPFCPFIQPLKEICFPGVDRDK